ncbi:MAG: ABC transporter ATP-binding protein [Gammaproteobacteria bacterium]|nr:ABC transporter ATP-binding protein [Gammaproteobacteria bacterium]
MHLLRTFVSQYPWQSVFLVVALLLSGLADGIGLSALLPALQLTLSAEAKDDGNDFTRFVDDAMASIGMTPTLGVLLSVILGAIVLKNILIFFANQRIGYIAADVATELRMTLLRTVIASRWEFFTHQSSGALANSMATEAWRASNAYVFAVRVLASLIEALVYLSVAVIASWQATVLCIVVGVAVLGASHVLVRIARRAGDRQTRWYRALLSSLTDVLASVKTFKAMGRDHVAEDVLSYETGKLRKALRRQALSEAGLESAQESLLALVVVVGIYLALVTFEIGLPMVTFMVLVLGQTLKRVGKVQKQYQKMLTCESAYWALDATIREARAAAEHTHGSIAPTLERAIEFKNVSFAYGTHEILSDATFEVPARRITCLVGDSGAGKTTVADLIIGLIAPTKGDLTIDGVPIADIDLRQWRHSIGYVPQDNLLLHDSVLQNVTLGDPTLNEADAMVALRAAGAEEFVAQLPEGIHAIVGERGTRLSGGQRQRIMIARSLAHRPRLLILDEATSALDADTEAGICATLKDLSQTVTILAVSHQPALAAAADRVYRLRNSRVLPVDAQPSRLSQ